MNIDANLEMLQSGRLFTDLDRNVIYIIKAACNQLKPKDVIVRIAGGWVRDKLLGRENDDIDIAVENSDCREFSNALKKVLGPETKSVIIESNDDASKHLDTARVCLFRDFWLDVCGLRSESFGKSKESGTPMSDARRRDYSINAMFYNINTGKVEDFVNGIQSLKERILRTPIPAIDDFRDDPLRIIRGFRFSAKLGYEIDDSIFEAATQVREQFIKTIVQERVTTELLKILRSDYPLIGIKNAHKANYLTAIFDKQNMWHLDEMGILTRIESAYKKMPDDISDNDNIAVTFAAVFLPLGKLGNLSDPAKKKKTISAIEYAIVRDMGAGIDISRAASILIHSYYSLIEFKKANLNRVQIGRFIMTAGRLWPLVRVLLDDTSFFDTTFKPYIEREKLQKAYEIKPLLSGTDVAKLHGVKPGPGLKQLIDKLIDWQLDNPNGTADMYISSISTP